MRKLLLALLLCLVTATGYCQSSSNPPLNVREEDGTPSAYPYMVKFSNGSVTDNGDGTVSINIPGLGGSTAWDDIGDPDADTSIALGGYETVFTSTLDEANHIVLKIDNTDADLANDTFLEVLEFTDNGDANGIFFDCRDNNGESKFKIGVEGNVTASGATFTIEKLATNHIGETTGAHGVVFDNDLSRAGKLSIDHIAEATGAHTIVFDNVASLANGTTATTQAASDNSTKLSTTAYVDTGLGTKLTTPTNNSNISGVKHKWTVSVKNGNSAITTPYIVPIDVTDAAIKVTKVIANTSSASYEIAGDLKYADARIGLANATVVNDFDTTSGVRSDTTMTSESIASGKFVYLLFDAAPNASDTDDQIVVEFDYD